MKTVPSASLLSIFIATALTLTSPLFSTSARANLVVNGGFEDGATTIVPGALGTSAGGGDTSLVQGDLSGWIVGPNPATDGPNVLATNSNAYYATASNGNTVTPLSGPHSGVLSAVFPNTPGYNGYIAQNIAGVVAGNVYQISFYLANQIGDPGDTNNSMTVNWGGTIASPGAPVTGGTNLLGPAAIPVPTDWTYYSYTVTAPTDNALLSFTGGDTPGAVLLDDVSVVAVPEASSFGMIVGFGLLGMASIARIRRRSPLLA